MGWPAARSNRADDPYAARSFLQTSYVASVKLAARHAMDIFVSSILPRQLLKFFGYRAPDPPVSCLIHLQQITAAKSGVFYSTAYPPHETFRASTINRFAQDSDIDMCLSVTSSFTAAVPLPFSLSLAPQCGETSKKQKVPPNPKHHK